MAFSIPSKALNDSSLHFSSEVIKALIGEPLSEEELLKVRTQVLIPVLNHRHERAQENSVICNLGTDSVSLLRLA
jgi:hypothetical protein